MTGRGGGGGRRVLLPPIGARGTDVLAAGGIRLNAHLPVEHYTTETLQSGDLGGAQLSVWLYEQLSIRIEGKIRGFDEFMNLVIDDAVEVKQITKTNDKESRRLLGQILLKGDNVSLIQSLSG
ncbi:hypothetical protein SAPIO_CDS1602 [Scedosporium apiospermum]|uniref:Small nuclear ribonucleoprotein E n=1 Tax=Pseudallescheria apiosperma TaxID=563466 RepID=A0A084GEN1_PSEDA|nr:uncharacterized protein SAPIO_CDS1602 [Scedosporium apiospermum]KEZ45793.1 hypothetical protein SAPIO_CDS1602 [Scedosporium apiospermum]